MKIGPLCIEKNIYILRRQIKWEDKYIFQIQVPNAYKIKYIYMKNVGYIFLFLYRTHLDVVNRKSNKINRPQTKNYVIKISLSIYYVLKYSLGTP